MLRIWLIVAAVLLSSCRSLPGQPEFNSTLVLPKTAGPSGYTQPQYTSSILQEEPASCSGLPAVPAKPARNACIVDLMTDIDAAYFNYEIQVNNAISRTNAALSIAQNAFSISGTAAGGTASTALNSLATFTGDVKTTISDDLLYKTTLQILISTMQADRAKQSAQIKLSMQSDADTYTMNQARNDLLGYFYAGTVTHALAEANNDAAAVAQKCQAANKAVETAIAQKGKPHPASAKGTGGDASAAAASTTSDQCNRVADSVVFQFDTSSTTADLMTLLAPNGVYNKGAAQSLNSCIKSTGVPAGLRLDAYTLPNGSYDLGSLIADSSVDPSYKQQILTCAKSSLTKQQAGGAGESGPSVTRKPMAGGKAGGPHGGPHQ